MPRNQVRWFAPGGETMPISKRELLALEKEGQAALIVQTKKLERAEIGLQDMRHLGDQVYEIRAQVRDNHYRATVYQDSPVHPNFALSERRTKPPRKTLLRR